MKKVFYVANILTLMTLAGCSSWSSPKKERALASEEYQCHFSEMIGGEKAEFVFIPDALKLKIQTPSKGEEVIYLEEDNFIAGGFTYTQSPKKGQDWDVSKVEFVSFVASPKVSIKFARTPASKKLSVSKSCSPQSK